MVFAMTLSVINRETCSVVLTVSGAIMIIHEIAHNSPDFAAHILSLTDFRAKERLLAV